MLAILGITAPIFLLIGIGFFSVRYGLFTREQIAGMGRFVITFALPALVVRALLERPLEEVFDWHYVLGFALASQLVFWGGFAFSRLVRRESTTTSAMLALGMSVSNSGFIGYPIAAMAVGPAAVVGMALGMIVENLLMIPLALVLAELGQQSGKSAGQALRETFARLLRNPVILGIAFGLGMALLGLPLPPILATGIDMLANAAAPVALLVIGGSLSGLKAGGFVNDALQLALGKLVLHPLLVMACFSLLPVDPQLRTAGLLIACAPMMSIFPLLGQRYGLEGRCAAALVATTVCAFVSISVFVGWLG